ncbi:hypothetical protein [Rhodococcus tukisamuensis]|uniref:hypothetical protein n=1 Tax=Rhodococcus tukisamuensis TaxID=168276 RepID=UPI00147635FD|nr:hypothetical protein [Rhodococcus tukisamuensis]
MSTFPPKSSPHPHTQSFDHAVHLEHAPIQIIDLLEQLRLTVDVPGGPQVRGLRLSRFDGDRQLLDLASEQCQKHPRLRVLHRHGSVPPGVTELGLRIAFD